MSRTRVSRSSAFVVLSASVMVLAACMTDYQKGVDDPVYGPPTGLYRPGSSNGSDGGTSPGGGPVCTQGGGTVLETGVCPVTFKQILETFRTAQCNAASGCHGGQTEPLINPDDPNGTWNAFAAFTVRNVGKPYINPCSTDATQSAMACNLNPAQPCGVLMPQGGTYDPTKLKDIETWLACGSPNN